MTELFKIADCLESPKGIVIAGANQKLDMMAHDELQNLLDRICSVSVVGRDGRLNDLKVHGFSVTTSVGNKRNVFLLLGGDVSQESIPRDGVVFYSVN